MELGPLGPAPAHSGLSFHDGVDVRLRGGIRRAGGKSSWGGGEGGEGSTRVAGDADGFEVSHFGCRIRCRASDGSFEESDPIGGKRGKVLIECAIRLKTNCAEVRCAATGQNSNGNIGCLRESRDGVWE